MWHNENRPNGHVNEGFQFSEGELQLTFTVVDINRCQSTTVTQNFTASFSDLEIFFINYSELSLYNNQGVLLKVLDLPFYLVYQELILWFIDSQINVCIWSEVIFYINSISCHVAQLSFTVNYVKQVCLKDKLDVLRYSWSFNCPVLNAISFTELFLWVSFYDLLLN